MTYTPVQNIAIADGASNDAFARLRVSNTETLFESVQRYGDDLLKWESAVSGTGSNTASLADSAMLMSTGGTTAGALAVRQTRRHLRYQAGKSTLVLMTFKMSAYYQYLRWRVGQFDSDNGIFFERGGTGASEVRRFVVRSNTGGSPADNAVEQDDWNLDKLDGTGASGTTLDMTKAQLLVIDYQWLGVGRVRVGFDIDGRVVYAHEFLHANNETTVYSRTMTLPLRLSVEVTGGNSSTAGTMLHICSTVLTEGGTGVGQFYEFSHNNGVTPISVTTRRPILSVRAKTAGPNSVRNTGALFLREVELNAVGNGSFYEIVLNGALTGASWSSVDATYSLAEKDTSATAISGGIVIHSGYVLSGAGASRSGTADDFSKDLALVYSSLGNVQDTLSIVCTSMSGTSSVLSSMCWVESGI